MSQKYFGDWSGYEDIRRELVGSGPFNYETREYAKAEVPESFPTERQVILACYDNGGYDGSAFVLYTKKRKLYIWQDSHCSCNGLTWNEGGETTWKTLEAMDPWGLTSPAKEALMELVAKKLKKTAQPS